MGTPAYAVPTLEALIDHHEVVCVFSRPDAISKRGNTLLPCSVKEAALRHDIVCKTPRTLRDEEVVSEIAAYEPDVIVVAAYGMILPKEVLETPRYGCLNLHASLLPRWRGAAPIQPRRAGNLRSPTSIAATSRPTRCTWRRWGAVTPGSTPARTNR